MLSPFSVPPFQPWGQVNPLLIRHKKDSKDRRVIMDLSWRFTPGCSVNGGTPKDTYLGLPNKTHLLSAPDNYVIPYKAGRKRGVML